MLQQEAESSREISSQKISELLAFDEIDSVIILHCNVDTLISLNQVHRQRFSSILSNANFLKILSQHHKLNKSPTFRIFVENHDYSQFTKLNSRYYTQRCLSYFPMEHCLYRAAEAGDEKIMGYCIDRMKYNRLYSIYDYYHINLLKSAARGANLDLTYRLLSVGIGDLRWSNTLYVPEHYHLPSLKNNLINIIEEVLISAAESGNFEFFIELTQLLDGRIPNFGKLAIGAAEGGNLLILEYIENMCNKIIGNESLLNVEDECTISSEDDSDNDYNIVPSTPCLSTIYHVDSPVNDYFGVIFTEAIPIDYMDTIYPVDKYSVLYTAAAFGQINIIKKYQIEHDINFYYLLVSGQLWDYLLEFLSSDTLSLSEYIEIINLSLLKCSFPFWQELMKLMPLKYQEENYILDMLNSSAGGGNLSTMYKILEYYPDLKINLEDLAYHILCSANTRIYNFGYDPSYDYFIEFIGKYPISATSFEHYLSKSETLNYKLIERVREYLTKM